MKKVSALILIGLFLIAAIPAFASPSENASPQAFQSQAIKICREMMGDAVQAGEMTKDQLNACIKMMKESPCTGMTDLQ